MGSVNYMVIDFDPQGGAESMHREELLDLSFLGKQSITRASDLRFNETTQKWDIWVCVENDFKTPPPAACGFSSYSECRDVEVRWFEVCRRAGVAPLSSEGIGHLAVAKFYESRRRQAQKVT